MNMRNSALGLPALLAVAAVAAIPVGTISTFDTERGPVEAIYLPGAASVAAGDLVAYERTAGGATVVRATATNTANSGRSVAVALAPVTAGNFGWFQIGGLAVVNAVAGTTTDKTVFASATAGSVTATAAAGVQIAGARTVSGVGTPSAGKAYVSINRPTAQTQIT